MKTCPVRKGLCTNPTLCGNSCVGPVFTDMNYTKPPSLRMGGTTSPGLKSESIIKRFYDPWKNKPDPNPEAPEHSVDVFIMDEDGMHGLAAYSFADEKWIFHTDTLVDYDEEGAETKWRWYYPPFTKKQIFSE